MPSTRRIPANTALPTEIPSPQHPFAFPQDRHLLITTPRHVFTWDAAGVHTLFASSRGGIVTAKEARDGSGVLAIASSSVVVMHDTKRGKQESWGLNAPQDDVRYIEYAPDAKTLYLTTSSDGNVQQYSTESSRLLSPVQRHEDPPMALAVSPTGHLLLSASHRPPVIYLKNTTHNTASVQIQPNASSAPVCCATFHPERPNVFLLAFRDGIIAVYDATKLSRQDKDSHSQQQGAGDGEIGRLQATHRAVMTGDDEFRAPDVAPPIAGASFLPGFKTRVVTAGRDGRCKLIDFSKGGEILRTWHAKAPLTSLSVLAIKSDVDFRPRNNSIPRPARTFSSGSHTIGGPTSTSCIIAVSRIDGKVHLYDSVGLLVAQTAVSSQEEKILSLEWAKGPSLAPCKQKGASRRFSEEADVDLAPGDRAAASTSSAVGKVAKDSAAVPRGSGMGLPIALRDGQAQSSRKFTLHPDELEGTVRYTPSSVPRALEVPTGAEYHDLFSPVKPAPFQNRASSPPKSRPRISSQTFKATPDGQNTGLVMDNQRQPMASAVDNGQPTSATTFSANSQPFPTSGLKPARRMSTHVSPSGGPRRQITFAHDGSNRSIASVRKGKVNTNAQVLADIRKLSEGNSSTRHGTLSSYATSQRQHKTEQQHLKARYQQANQHVREVDVADSTTWPTDSASLSSHISNKDIWLTDSEDERSEQQRRSMEPLTRPPARQTSRSKVDSSGTISTAADMPQRTVDGSTDDQMFTAVTHLSPKSEDVREMFPRSSSLSPGKRRSARKSRRASPSKRSTALTSLGANVAMGRAPKSPWARLRAGKGAIPVQMFEDPPLMSGGLPRSDSMMCFTCPETKARVQGLETEVAHLKGEVLALKAILRRNGLPFPACLR